MRIAPFSRSAGGLSPPLLVALACFVLPSCRGDTVLDPLVEPAEDAAEAAAVGQRDGPTVAPVTLSVEDMLMDPLFQALTGGIGIPGLAEPLVGAVDALAAGQRGRAMSLIARARAEVVALEDEPAAAEALTYWSAIEQYLEEAELLRFTP